MDESNTPEVKGPFSEKEQKLLIAALYSLKTGHPELDMAKFVKAGEFKTLKTSQNVWSKLKKKFEEHRPEGTAVIAVVASEENEEVAEATPKSKKKTAATPKKRGKQAADGNEGNDDDDHQDATPVKKVKQETATDSD